MRIPIAIQTLRDRGLKQTWVAQQLGISQAYLNDLLTGRRGADKLHEYAPRIAAILNVPVEEIFPDLPQPETPEGSE